MSQLSKSRDMRVLELLEKHKYCTTGQVAEVLFSNIKDPRWRLQKAAQRLRVLHNNGLCSRMRIPGQHFIYTVRGPKYNHLVNHYLTAMDVWLTLVRTAPKDSRLKHEVEMKFDDLVCDLWAEYSNPWLSIKQEYFFEIEIASTGDPVEKIRRYESLAWRRSIEKLDCRLIIIYDNQRTKRKIDAYKTSLNLKVIFLEDFEKEWKW